MEHDGDVHTVSDAVLASIDESLMIFCAIWMMRHPNRWNLQQPKYVALDMDSGGNGIIFCDSKAKGENGEDELEVVDQDVD